MKMKLIPNKLVFKQIYTLKGLVKYKKKKKKIKKKKKKTQDKENRLIPLLFQNRIHHWLSKDYCSINYCKF